MSLVFSATVYKNILQNRRGLSLLPDPLRGMTSYKQQIYMNGLKAVVNGTTTVPAGEVNIKFYFNWFNNSWTLSEII